MKPRPLRFCEGIVYVPLTKGYEARIDIQDAPMVSRYNWYAKTSKRTSTIYACGWVSMNGRKNLRPLPLHRAILSPPSDALVDHINRDGLDCRRVNMRLASNAENGRNSKIRAANKSGMKGVSFDRKKGKWLAQIMINRKGIFLGYYETIVEAHNSYVAASQKLHGEFSRSE